MPIQSTIERGRETTYNVSAQFAAGATEGGLTMYILEHKKLYIVPEPLRKNRCCQSYRWEQVCMCSDRSVLEEMIAKRRDLKEWRITETAYVETAEQKMDG